jgi:hypothetical protein
MEGQGSRTGEVRCVRGGVRNGSRTSEVRGARVEQGMNRADLYLKLELDLDDLEKPERIAAEICRMLRKVYGVRQVEVSSIVERDR